MKRVKASGDEPKIEQEQRVREQHLLAISMRHKSIGSQLGSLPVDVFSPQAQETARYITEHPGISPTESEYVKILTLLYEEYYQHTEESELAYQTKQLLSRLVHTYAKTKKRALAEELATANETNQKTLLLAVKQLDDLVTQYSN